MGKSNKSKKGSVQEKKSSPVAWVVAAVIAVAAVLAISGNLPFLEGGNETGKSFNLPGKETRTVLDPAMFTGQTRMAYAAAQKYPEILNEVFCYCFCDEAPFHHKTLLSCFVEKHGAG